MAIINVAYDHAIFSRQAVGGVSRYLVKLASLSRQFGVNPIIIAPLHSNLMLKDADRGLVKGLYLDWADFYKYKGAFLYLNQFATDILSIKEKPAIIHETYYSLFPSIKKRVPRVLTIHDFVHEKYPHLFKSSDNTIELKKAAIKRSDHLICISQKTKEDLLEFYRISENKVSVVYHGVEKDSFISLPPHPLETKYFLYVGSRAAYKNFDLVLQVFSNYGQDLEDCQLLVFGGGAFSLAEKRRIYELNLEDRVRIESGPDSLLANRYQNAVALIYPSLYEGFGFPPLEAMQYQCPAIVSNASCLPEISGDAALLFDPFSQAALADAMIKVMSDGALNNQLRELGSQRVKDFSWSRTVLETTRIYHQLVG